MVTVSVYSTGRRRVQSPATQHGSVPYVRRPQLRRRRKRLRSRRGEGVKMYRGKQCRSPLKSVKEFCKECMNIDTFMGDIWECPSERCNIFPFRMGKTERGDYPSVPVLSAIRNQCLECLSTYQEIENCTCDGKNPCNGLKDYKCSIYEFRFGTNPYIKTKVPSEKQVQARLSFAQMSRSET